MGVLFRVLCVLGILILSEIFLEVDFGGWFAGFCATLASIVLLVAFVGRYHTAKLDERVFELGVIDAGAVEKGGDGKV